MRKITIKLPDEKIDKFRLQRQGWRGRRYTTAAGLINRLIKAFPKSKLREKTAIRVKEGRYIKGKYKARVINETVDSDNPHYLLYTTACFLEDDLSQKSMRKLERRYLKHENT